MIIDQCGEDLNSHAGKVALCLRGCGYGHNNWHGPEADSQAANRESPPDNKPTVHSFLIPELHPNHDGSPHSRHQNPDLRGAPLIQKKKEKKRKKKKM
jgi:hypothetical protein